MSNFTSQLTPAERIFVAIDVDTLDEARRLMDQLVGSGVQVKVGLQLATREGWAACVAAAHERGLKVFCDSKFKDIPNTLEHAAQSLCAFSPEYFTVMADTNLLALQAVRRGVDTYDGARPKIIGVTVLTAMDDNDARAIYGAEAGVKVAQFGAQAVAAGFEAIVCSPHEVALFRADTAYTDTALITPGVRPAWAVAGDQQRVMTPGEAIKAGADMLVIGRPITQPPVEIGNSQAAIQHIINEIQEALI